MTEHRPSIDPTDARLRRWMHEEAPAAAPDAILRSVNAAARHTRQQRFGLGWLPLVAAAAAIVAIAAYGTTVGLRSGEEPPGSAASVDASPPAPASNAAPSSPSASAPADGPWPRATVELPADNSSRMHAVASGRDGLVAVGGGGSIEGFGGALAWHSVDGQSWALTVDRHAERDGSQMSDVVATASGFVAVGDNPVGVPVWLSADGRSWREADAASAPRAPDHALTAIAVAGDELLAIGFASEDDQQIATLWTSVNGAAWTRLGVPGTFAGAWPRDIAATEDGTAVIVGMTEPGSGDPMAWVVRGGTVEEPVRLPSDDPEAVVGVVVATPTGYTALGSGWEPGRANHLPLAWRSADGRAWEPVEPDAIGFILGAAFIADRGVVAVGQTAGLESSDVVAWDLADEGAWRTILLEHSNGAGFGVVERPAGGLVIVGSDDPDGSAVVWLEP